MRSAQNFWQGISCSDLQVPGRRTGMMQEVQASRLGPFLTGSLGLTASHSEEIKLHKTISMFTDTKPRAFGYGMILSVVVLMLAIVVVTN